jgi:hypothetical protein
LNVSFLNAVLGVIEFALDRGEAFFATQLGNKIDASVAPVPTVRSGPILIGLHGFILLNLHRVMSQEGNGHALKIFAFVALGARGFTV